MTDRELLELAAKAAGMNGEWKSVRTARVGAFRLLEHRATEHFYVDGKPWNPLTDDGDALRLAVKLEFNVDTHGMHVRVCLPFGPTIAHEPKCDDALADTRRAIVRAAAVVGEQMP